MHPVAFSIFGLTIYWYGVLITLGILAAITFSWFRAKRYGLTHDDLTDLAFLVIIVGIFGARILYILTNLEYFIANPGQIFQLQMQGMAFLGIVLFNIPAVLIFAKVRKINFWRMVDLAAPAIAIGYFFGRLGCFMGGCCYGPNYSWGIKMQAVNPDVAIFPTQLLNALVAVTIFVVLFFLGRNKKLKAGELFIYFIYLYAGLSFGTEFLRADAGHSPLFGTPFNSAQLADMAMIVAALLLHFLYIKKQETLSQVDDETVKAIELRDSMSGKKPSAAESTASNLEPPADSTNTNKDYSEETGIN
jgi:phosphatidylglycerol:prolipoprotein diacylglycerol transferase